MPIKLVHKMSEKQVIKEMTAFPLKHVDARRTSVAACDRVREDREAAICRSGIAGRVAHVDTR